MKLIVGLGNPGLRYERTRHNAGFMAIDRLVARHAKGEPARGRFDAAVIESRLEPKSRGSLGAPSAVGAGAVPGGAGAGDGGAREPVKVAFIKPATFMNLSGKSVSQAVQFFKVDPSKDLLVIADDLALPLGRIRVKAGGGAGGHNGLLDIARCLGSEQFPRCRVGIDAKPPFMDQADWVLSRFTDDELPTLEGALDRVVEAVEVFIRDGVDACMNRANADPEAPARPKKPRPGEEPEKGTGPPG